RQRVEHQLGGGAGLETGGAGEDFGTGRGRDQQGAALGTSGVARHQDRGGPPDGGRRQRRAHERRHAAGRDAHHDVTAADTRAHRAAGRARVVLRALARAEDGRAAARHDGLHEGARRAEGRRALGGFQHAVALLSAVRGARLAALFAPEHGVWGAPQDLIFVGNERDPVTRLRVTSLYGERREPTAAMLRGLDVLVIDPQDVGARYYTY